MSPTHSTDPTSAYPPASGGGSAPPGSGAGGYPPPPGQASSSQPPPAQPPGCGPPAGQAPGYGQPGGSGQAPGYGQPPPPGFGQAPGYPPGAYAGYATSDEKTWAMLTHFGGIVLGFIAPLIVLLAKGNESPTLRAHAVEALNFQITWGIASLLATVIAICTFGVLFFLPLVTWAVVLIFSIIAGMRANEGQLYQYPMTVRLVK
jgi:uncharacterized Tic20 family protein